MKNYSLIFLFLVWGLSGNSQDSRKITFPDIPDFITLSADLHQHTVFSDGSVWPDIRVQEAILDGVDIISLTEHLEYQPHKEDLPHPDRNRSFLLAKEMVKDKEIMLIHGAEITRSLPPGHSNALFIEDANKLIMDDPVEVFREAKKQGAFVFWNHPNWVGQKSDGIAEVMELTQNLIDEGLLHGIEVVNETTYSEEAFQIALDNNLTVMATSDIHGLVDWMFDIPGGGHRPVTLVFCSEKSQASVKEALQKGQTVSWHGNNLIGKPAWLNPLISASLEVVKAEYVRNREVLNIRIKNNSDARFLLKNESEFTLHQNSDLIEIAPQEETGIQIKTKDFLTEIAMKFTVLNAYEAPRTNATYTLSAVPVKN